MSIEVCLGKAGPSLTYGGSSRGEVCVRETSAPAADPHPPAMESRHKSLFVLFLDVVVVVPVLLLTPSVLPRRPWTLLL